MIWETIYGREELVRTLQEAIRLDKVAHAYLFYGPAGIGKKTIAQAFATALNCLDGQKGVVRAYLAAERQHKYTPIFIKLNRKENY